MINDQEIFIKSADRGSCVVILSYNIEKNKKAKKIWNNSETMIYDDIEYGTFRECKDITLGNLKMFQNSLRRNFKDHEKLDK